MFEKLKKILKRNCKNQGKNITTGVVIAFLLSCNLAMGTELFVGLDTNGEIKIFEGAIDGNITTDYGSIDDNGVWTVKNLSGDINITIGSDVGRISINNGNDLTQPVSVGNITFAGNLRETVKEDTGNKNGNLGNGFALLSYNTSGDSGAITTGAIKNSGILIGKAVKTVFVNTGNGFALGSFSRDKLTGKVEITGIVENSGFLSGETGELRNMAYNAGNGFALVSYNDKLAEEVKITGAVTNSGFLSGKAGNTSISNANVGSGFTLASYDYYKISSAVTIEGDITNSGYLVGIVEMVKGDKNANIGNGFAMASFGNNYNFSGGSGTVKIGTDGQGTVLSSGYHVGIVESISSNNNVNIGNGFAMASFVSASHSYDKISAGEVTLGSFINSGLLSGYVGEVTGTDNKNYGNGIGLVSFTKNGTSAKASMDSFANVGLVMGKEHGVLVEGGEKSGIKNYANYGVIVGNTPVSSKDTQGSEIDDNTSAGKGITITLEEKDVDSNKQLEITKVVVGDSTINYGNGSEYDGYTVINSITNGEYSEDNGNLDTALDSSIQLSQLNGTDKFILNGVNKGLVVDKNIGLTNSIINSCGEAVSITGATTFTGENVTINGGGLRKDIESEYIAIAGDGSVNNLELKGTSVVNGDIDLGAGADKIEISGDTTINGKLYLAGDTFNANNSIINGEIKSSGGNKINFDNSVLNGNATLTDDTFTASGATINGDITYSDTANSQSSSITNSSLVNGDINIESGTFTLGVGDVSIKPNSFLTMFDVSKVKVNGDININTDGGTLKLGNDVVVYGDINFTGTGTVNLTVDTDSFENIYGNFTVDSTVTSKNLNLSYQVDGNTNKDVFQKHWDKFVGFDVTLKDGGNTIDFSGLSVAGKTVYGGTGNDTFIIDQNNLNDGIKIADKSDVDEDTLQLTFDINGNEDKINNNFSGKRIEILQLADTGNTVDMSKLKLSSFEKYLGGTGADTFINVTAEQLVNKNIFGGADTDTINMKVAIENGSSLAGLFTNQGIEKINLTGNNSFTVDSTLVTGIGNNLEVNFGDGENKITFDDVLKSQFENLKFDFTSGDNDTLTFIKNDVGIKEFNYQVNGAETIVLGTTDNNEEWKITETLTGTTNLDLNKNALAIDGTASGTNLTLDFGFADSGLTVSNGTIKIDSTTLTFDKGVETDKYTFDFSDKTINFDSDLKFESYAFLEADKDGLSVLSWEDLIDGLGITDEPTYADNYNTALQLYNKTGQTSLTNAFNSWSANNIADWITKTNNTDVESASQRSFTLINNKITYNSLIAGNITIDSSKDTENRGNQEINVTFNALASDNIYIKNNHQTGEITFADETVTGNIDATDSSQSLTLNFKNSNTTIGNISFGNANSNIINLAGTSASNKSSQNNKFQIGDIDFGDGTGNKLNITNTSAIGSIGKITADGGEVKIDITTIDEDGTTGFNAVLVGANAGENNSITVQNKANTTIFSNYSGELTFDGTDNTIKISNKNSLNRANEKYEGTIIANTTGNTFEIDGSYFGGNLELGTDNTVLITNSTIDGMEVNTTNGNTADITIGDGAVFENTGLTLGGGEDKVLFTAKTNTTVFANGGTGTDTFTIGSTTGTLNLEDDPYITSAVLSGKLTSFENIQVNNDITFASDLELDGTNEINIGADKTLALDIDYDKIANGKVIGHALYDKTFEVKSDGGKIVISTAKANGGEIIDFSQVNLTGFDDKKESILASNSSVHELIFKENGDIEIALQEHIMGDKGENIKYTHLDKIYQSIASTGKIGQMSASTSLSDKGNGDDAKIESIKAQLEYYGKIYHSSPYAYSHKVSKKTVAMINEAVLNTPFKAQEGQWITYGAMTGRGAEDFDSFYGKSFYGKADSGKTEAGIDSNITGAYVLGEYGAGENLSLGVVLAGNRSDSDIGSSQIKGNGYYLGGYAKYDIGNTRLTAGAGFQHNYYDSTRITDNKYQSTTEKKKYTDNTLSAYGGVEYFYSLGNDFTLKPKAVLTVTHTMQDNITENNPDKLTLDIDNKDFTSVDGEIGVEIIKTVPLEKGKLSFTAGAGVLYAFEGAEEEELTARIIGGTDFTIISAEEEKSKVRYSVGASLEKDNGVIYNIRGNYINSSDNDEYNIEVGIGYKF